MEKNTWQGCCVGKFFADFRYCTIKFDVASLIGNDTQKATSSLKIFAWCEMPSCKIHCMIFCCQLVHFWKQLQAGIWHLLFKNGISTRDRCWLNSSLIKCIIHNIATCCYLFSISIWELVICSFQHSKRPFHASWHIIIYSHSITLLKNHSKKSYYTTFQKFQYYFFSHENIKFKWDIFSDFQILCM